MILAMSCLMRVIAAFLFVLGEMTIKASTPTSDPSWIAILFVSAAAVIWTVSGDRS